jgi:hypothetical protein
MNTATMTNEQVDQFLDKYPLLAQGYAALECPHCDQMCFPQTRYSNDTVRYNAHKCKDKLLPWMESTRSFSILANGELKE